MPEVTVVDTVAFSRGFGGGTPCPLVLGAESLHPAEMQALAAQFGHETAFLLPPTGPEAAVRLRYFVPRHEMTMCVHATVAEAPGCRRAEQYRVCRSPWRHL